MPKNRKLRVPKKKSVPMKKAEARPASTFVWKNAEHGLIEAGDVFVMELNRDHRYALRSGKRHIGAMVMSPTTCRGTVDQLVSLRNWIQRKHPDLVREWADEFNADLPSYSSN